MDREMVQIEIRLLGKEYLIACPAAEREALLESARLLDQRLREIRSSGKVIGGERMAIMAGLNIAHELLQLREQQDGQHVLLEPRLRAMRDKIDVILDEDRQLDL